MVNLYNYCDLHHMNFLFCFLIKVLCNLYVVKNHNYFTIQKNINN